MAAHTSTPFYILAVSGGVDSVVLLDLLARRYPGRVIVAHFDHGIRPDSHDNALFVRHLARQYDLIAYEERREELGKDASEAVARRRRYNFLRDVAQTYRGVIVTAHHADDEVETVAINLWRGTGWRGLAVLDMAGVHRPLLGLNKAALLRYAQQRQLRWYEDSTNASDAYLRNRLRRRLIELTPEAHLAVRQLASRQRQLKRLIDEEVNRLLPATGPCPRYTLIMYPEAVAIELLRSLVARETGYRPTSQQAGRALLALKTARPGTTHSISRDVTLVCAQTTFVVERTGKVLS